jgi:hypothetical protein
MTKEFIPKIGATPILEGEDAERFWTSVQENQDKKLPPVPTPRLDDLRKKILAESQRAPIETLTQLRILTKVLSSVSELLLRYKDLEEFSAYKCEVITDQIEETKLKIAKQISETEKMSRERT